MRVCLYYLTSSSEDPNSKYVRRPKGLLRARELLILPFGSFQLVRIGLYTSHSICRKLLSPHCHTSPCENSATGAMKVYNVERHTIVIIQYGQHNTYSYIEIHCHDNREIILARRMHLINLYWRIKYLSGINGHKRDS